MNEAERARARISVVLDDIEETEWELRRLGIGAAAERDVDDLWDALEVIERIECKLLKTMTRLLPK